MIEKKIEVKKTYVINGICDKCGANMLVMDSAVMNFEDGIKLSYRHKCVSCGNLEASEIKYPYFMYEY